MKLMDFTEDEIKNNACYIAKYVEVNNKEQKVNVLGKFYSDSSISIVIEDSETFEEIAELSMDVSKGKLSKLKFESQIIINHNIVDQIESKLKEVIDEIAYMELSTIEFNSVDTFILTLKIEHFEKMVHFLEVLREK